MVVYGIHPNRNIVQQQLNCSKVNLRLSLKENRSEIRCCIALMAESRINNFQRRQLTSHMLRT